MNYSTKIMALVIIFTAIIQAGCKKTTEKDDKNKMLLLLVGRNVYSADCVAFKMTFVPGGKTFPTGVNDEGTGYVPSAYWIGETEVTYELWNKVRHGPLNLPAERISTPLPMTVFPDRQTSIQ
jgi:hypothetical protein